MDAATLVPALAPVVDAPGGAPAPDEQDGWEACSRRIPGRAGETETYLAIEGIHCPGCALVIEQALAGVPGVRSVEVNGASATARVTWTPGEARPSQWLA